MYSMRYKAYRYRLYPNKEQQELINKHIGCCRYIYNYGLEKKIKAYQECKKAISRFDIQRELRMLKKNEETSFLKEGNSLSLQAALACLDNAFTRFFKEKKGFPKFKTKRDTRQSFQVVQNTKVDFECNRIFIPKFKEGIKCKLHRTFEGEIKPLLYQGHQQEGISCPYSLSCKTICQRRNLLTRTKQ